MVEPFAVGMQAAVKARITPGDVAIVLGAGTIGIMIALAALAGGFSKVLIADVHQPKLDIADRYEGIVPINISKADAKQQVLAHTDGWGANIVFEASGASKAITSLVDLCGPDGTICWSASRSTRTRWTLLGRSTRRSRFAQSFVTQMFLTAL